MVDNYSYIWGDCDMLWWFCDLFLDLFFLIYNCKVFLVCFSDIRLFLIIFKINDSFWMDKWKCNFNFESEIGLI